MIKILLLLTLWVSLFAKSDYDLRIAFGRSDDNDFGQIISGQTAPYSINAKVAVIDLGYRFAEDAFDLPIDFYAKLGLSRFIEKGNRDDVYENIFYVKAYYNFFDKKLRFGLADGVSYTYGTLYVEKLDAVENSGKNSNVLNYLEVSLDFDLGKVSRFKALDELYFGVALKHRSGIFGLINNVKHGGSNYELLYLEKNF